jgi:hypothetical protein
MSALPKKHDTLSSIKVKGNVEGSIVYGDYNFVVNENHGTIVYQASKPSVYRHSTLPARPRPPLLFLDREVPISQANQAIDKHLPVAVFGTDGAGKTSLLKQLAHTLPQGNFPDGVIYIDCEWETPPLKGLNDLAQAVFDTLYVSDPPIKVTTASARAYFGSIKPLILLDHLLLPPAHFEKLPDIFSSAELIWATSYAPHANIAWEIPLYGLPPEDSYALFVRLAKIEILDKDQKVIKEICEILEHLPQAIITFIRWIQESNRTLQEALQALKAEENNAQNGLQRVFTAIFASLGKTEKIVLKLASTVSGCLIDEEVLLQASGLEPRLAENALRKLEAISLVLRNYSDLRINFAFRSFTRQIFKRKEESFLTLGETLIRHLRHRAEDRDFVRRQMGSLFVILEASARSGHVDLAAACADILSPLAVLSGKWDIWEHAYLQVVRVAEQQGAAFVVGRALHELGTHALGMDNKARAIELLSRARDIRLANQDTLGAAFSQHNLNIISVPPPLPPKNGQTGTGLNGFPWTKLIGFFLGGMSFFSLVALALFFSGRAISGANGLATETPFTSHGSIIFLTNTPEMIPTWTSTNTITYTPTSTNTYTSTPTLTYTPTPTDTPTPTPTLTYTLTPTDTPTPTPTLTYTSTPTDTLTPTPTLTPSLTNTEIPTPTLTITPTLTESLPPPPLRFEQDIRPAQDGYVEDHSPDYNYGEHRELIVGYYADVDAPFLAYTYLYFDLSAIPAEADILSANLSLFMMESFQKSELQVTVYTASEIWDEHKITWNDRPETEDAIASAPVGNKEGYYDLNLTRLVIDWIRGARENYGIILTGDQRANYSRTFSSRENPEYSPILSIVYLINQEFLR